MKLHKIIASLLCSAMLSFSTQGCAGQRTTKDTATIEIPQSTAMVVLFSATGEISFRDRLGKVLPPCEFCDEDLEKKYGRDCRDAKLCNEDLEQKFGPGCENSDEYINICPGSLTTQVQELTSIGLLRHKGSGCYNASTGGYNSGVCYQLCKTFPQHPLCK